MSGIPLRHTYRIPDNAVIAIGGTVGVGKSTLTCCLAAALGFRPSLEKADNPYLPRFYSDQRRWSFHLQVSFLAERFKEHVRLYQSGGGFVQDRTLYEDAGIFARMLYENGLMAPEDYRTYTTLVEAMLMTPSFRTRTCSSIWKARCRSSSTAWPGADARRNGTPPWPTGKSCIADTTNGSAPFALVPLSASTSATTTWPIRPPSSALSSALPPHLRRAPRRSAHTGFPYPT